MLFIMCNKKKTVVSSINALKITRYIWKLHRYNWIISLHSSQIPSDHSHLILFSSLSCFSHYTIEFPQLQTQHGTTNYRSKQQISLFSCEGHK
jgi:hypothetical protein